MKDPLPTYRLSIPTSHNRVSIARSIAAMPTDPLEQASMYERWATEREVAAAAVHVGGSHGFIGEMGLVDDYRARAAKLRAQAAEVASRDAR